MPYSDFQSFDSRLFFSPCAARHLMRLSIGTEISMKGALMEYYRDPDYFEASMRSAVFEKTRPFGWDTLAVYGIFFPETHGLYQLLSKYAERSETKWSVACLYAMTPLVTRDEDLRDRWVLRLLRLTDGSVREAAKDILYIAETEEGTGYCATCQPARVPQLRIPFPASAGKR